MENSQKNKFSMYLAVLGVMQSNQSVWTALTGIASLVTALQNAVTDIQTQSGLQGTPRTGVAQGKNRKQVEMINLTAAVAGDLHAYAVAQQKDTLAAQSDVEVSDLVNMADSLVGPRCRELYTLAHANAAALVGYGTTNADLSALDSAINAYDAVVTAPRQAIATNSSVTADIASQIKIADALLKKQLDKAMVKFKAKNAAFYQAYKDARVIVDLGVVHEKAPTTPTP